MAAVLLAVVLLLALAAPRSIAAGDISDRWTEEEVAPGSSSSDGFAEVAVLKARLARARALAPANTKIMVVVKNTKHDAAWAHQLDRADEEGVIHGYGFDCADTALAYRQHGLPSHLRRVLVRQRAAVPPLKFRGRCCTL